MTEIRCGAKVETPLGVGHVIVEGTHGVVTVYFGDDHPYRQHPFEKSEVRLLEPESTDQMTVNGTYTPDGIRIDDARGTIELAQAVTNQRKPIRLEGLTYAQVTALIVHLDDLRRDMRYTAGQAKRNP